MWIYRDFSPKIQSKEAQPVKVLKGPRQVGKTTLLEQLKTHKAIYFDDLATQRSARENPRLFLDQFSGPLLLDEATIVPEIFFELKRRVDEYKRTKVKKTEPLDIWVTGSNQTLLNKHVRESLAGRASYFNLNTLSIHEHKKTELPILIMNGGWPELYSKKMSPVRYLNDLISTFIQKDIIGAAGIEKRAAFSTALSLIAARSGQIINYSDIAKNVSVDITTVKSWLSILEENGLLFTLYPYFNNLNQRYIKSPKIYFHDVGLATRLQGWTDYEPLFVSPSIGGLFETLVISEVTRFFINNGLEPKLFFLRTKEKIEIDLLISLPNNRYISAEIKMNPQNYTPEQSQLLKTTKLNVVDRWIIVPQASPDFENVKTIAIEQIWDELNSYFA